jgi:hypothetical protein
MKRTTAFLAVIVLYAVCAAVYAEGFLINEGIWPASWPEELEPLREQSRTFEGGLILSLHYEIPFTSREEFESAWPHILKVKSEGAPVILVRGPVNRCGTPIDAGVHINAPPRQTTEPEAPVPGPRPVRRRWINTTFIELVVDGQIVDLNRIPLPADTPIIDERFEEEPAN